MYEFNVNEFLGKYAVCPITQAVMVDPVITADGHTYERTAIAKWLRDHDTSPNTNNPLDHKRLTPNYALRIMIEELQRVAHPQPSAPPQEENDKPEVIQPCQKQKSLTIRDNKINIFVYGEGRQTMAVLHALQELNLKGLNLLYCFNPGQINLACYRLALQAADHVLLPLDLSNDPERYGTYAEELRSFLPSSRSFTEKVLTVNVTRDNNPENNRANFFRAQRLPQPHQQVDLHSLIDMQEYITEIVNKRAEVSHQLEGPQ